VISKSTWAAAARAFGKREAVGFGTEQNSEQGTETPRQAIVGACQMMAPKLAEHGFRFLKSKMQFIRKDGDLTYVIALQAWKWNRAGKHADVYIHAMLFSDSLAKWQRETEPKFSSDEGGLEGEVFFVHIGNLGRLWRWRRWNFVDKQKREKRGNHAVRAIEKKILPLFARCDGTAESIATLMKIDLIWQPSIVEYALANFGAGVAECAGRDYLRSKPLVRREYRKALASFDGSHRGTGPSLAQLERNAGLNFL
jgi:hypothetical protein